MIKPSPAPARSSPRRLPWKCLRPSHRKPARLAKEMPDPSWRKARPGSTFYCASCTQAVGQADVLAGPRDPPPRPGAGQAPRGHGRSSRPRRRLLTLATSRAKWKRGPKRNLPRLTHPEAPPGGGRGAGFRRLPESFALWGSGKASRSLPPGHARPGRAGRAPRGAASALTSGKKLSIVRARPATCGRPASRSRQSAPRKVPGNHARHGATLGSPSPRRPAGAIAFSLLAVRTFCSPKPKSLAHPSQTQPLSPRPPSSSLWGTALASGEQLVAHSSPRRRGRGGRLGSAPRSVSLSDPAAGARRGQRYSGHKASPESLSAREHSRREY